MDSDCFSSGLRWGSPADNIAAQSATVGVGASGVFNERDTTGAGMGYATALKTGSTTYVDGFDFDASHQHASVGSGTAHNNLQPYIVTYMWKRTA